jgi:hypothetical protein
MPPFARRACLLAAAALCIALLTAFSAQAMTMQVDVANVLTRMAYGTVSLAGAAILWLGKRGLDTLARMEKQLTMMSHELFGATGQNGMRSDVKEAKRLLKAHTKVLTVLADREGIDFDEDAR